MKTFFAGLSALLLASELLLPIGAGAQTPPPSSGANFCANLQKTQANATAIQNEITARWNQFQTRITTLKTNRATAIANGTNPAAELRKNLYAELNAAATTDAQKQAVATFQATVDAAVKTRQDAIKVAGTTFSSGIDEIAANENAAVKAAADQLKASLDAALSSASKACAAGQNSTTVSLAFRASAAAALSKFKTTLAPEHINSQVRALTAAYKQAVQAATSAYRTTLQQANAALQAAFAVTPPPPPATPPPAATPPPPSQ